MSGMSASLGLTVFLFTFLVWPAIIDLNETVSANAQEIALNNVPELKQLIKDESRTINQKIETNSEKIDRLTIMICKIPDVDC